MQPTALPHSRPRNFAEKIQTVTSIPVVLLALAIFVGDVASVLGDTPLQSDLFSQIKMSETTAAAKEPNVATVNKTNDVLGVVALSRILSGERLKAEVQAQSVAVKLSDLSANYNEEGPSKTTDKLRLTVDPEGHRVDVFLQLQMSQKAPRLDSETLYRLLSSISELPNIHLTATEKTLSLHTSLSNRDVTLEAIRNSAARLVSAQSLATEIVSPSKAENKTTQRDAVVSQQAAEPTTLISASKQSSIVGTWSAKTSSDDAWAIRFAKDKTFVMVHTRKGKNSVSKGTFELKSETLVVRESKGLTLQGRMELTSDTAFRWALQDANGKQLTTLAFSKK